MTSISQSQLTLQSGNKPIRMDVYVPDSPGKLPAVLALYGSGGGVEGMNEPATMLAAQGFAVFVLHYFDRTATTRVIDKQTIFRNFPAWGKTVWDAVSHLEQHPQVDANRIGLFGFSLGAYLSLSVASVDPRIKAVVEFFGGLPKEMRILIAASRPVLILHGEADPLFRFKRLTICRSCWRKMESRTISRYMPGAGHGFTDDDWRDAGIRSLRFLRKHLNDPDTP